MESRVLKCFKCGDTYETTSTIMGTCKKCGTRIPVVKRNIVSGTVPTKKRKNKSRKRKDDGEEHEPKKEGKSVNIFDSIVSGFNEDKKSVEPDISTLEPVPESVQAAPAIPPVIAPVIEVGNYLVAIVDILQSQLLEKKTPTKEQKAVLLTETLKICQVYLTVKVPDENDIKPIEIPAWGFAVATIAVLALPFILEKLKKKKDDKDEKEG